MSLAKRNSLAAGKEQSRTRKMVEEAKTQRDTDKAASKYGYKDGGMVKGKAKGYMCGGKVGKK
jgi:uncharacterized protein with FMN-binding domain